MTTNWYQKPVDPAVQEAEQDTLTFLIVCGVMALPVILFFVVAVIITCVISMVKDAVCWFWKEWA